MEALTRIPGVDYPESIPTSGCCYDSLFYTFINTIRETCYPDEKDPLFNWMNISAYLLHKMGEKSFENMEITFIVLNRLNEEGRLYDDEHNFIRDIVTFFIKIQITSDDVISFIKENTR